MKVKYTKFIPDIDPAPNILHNILPPKPFNSNDVNEHKDGILPQNGRAS